MLGVAMDVGDKVEGGVVLLELMTEARGRGGIRESSTWGTGGVGVD